MDWIFAALIAGCCVYICEIVTEYTRFHARVWPVILQCSEKAQAWTSQTRTETVRIQVARENIKIFRERQKETRVALNASRQALETQRQRNGQLQILLSKKRLKASRSRPGHRDMGPQQTQPGPSPLAMRAG